MRRCAPRPVLVVSRDAAAVAPLLEELRALDRAAVYIDACEDALDIVRAVQWTVVIVTVDEAADWCTCRRVAAAAACPVAVVTRFLAPDRRYRTWAFRAGAAAYVCPPLAPARLRELFVRLRSGETGVELVRGAGYCQMDVG